MELKEFIKETLEQITEAVKSAKKTNANIAPEGVSLNPLSGLPVINKFNKKNQNTYVSIVDFDISLAFEESKGNKRGISVMLANVGIGASKSDISKDQIVNRIKFSIPVLL